LKKRKEVAALVLALMIFISMLYSLPLVSAVYAVEEHYMPPEPDDSEPICALKTRTDGDFYMPNVATDLLKIEMLFNDSRIIGDQTGGSSPYPTISHWPSSTIDISDLVFVMDKVGKSEGSADWDYMADVIPSRAVDISDLVLVINNIPSSGNYIYDLTGVTVVFNTGEEKLPDSDGFVVIPSGAIGFTVKRNGTSIGAMVIFYGPREPPIAYSTTFDFTVPAYTGADVGKEVWYYILARLYMPSGLSGQNFYFVATADYSVQNVKMNGYSKAGNGSSVNIDLGKLGEGYHLLEFEFVDVSGGGSLNFHVATAASQYAWLSRFRIYVPNYSDNKYEYTVKTHSNFPISDTYFLKGYADDFIDNLKLGGGLLWLDWEWDMGEYDRIYSWEDGFIYPLGYLDPAAWRDIEFTFGEILGEGLLDFQYISWTYQSVKIGAPIFLAKCESDTIDGSPWAITDKKAYAGSEWYSEPGTSDRKFSVNQEISAYTHAFLSGDHRITFLFSLGVGWLPMSTAPTPDFGITMNLTILNYSGETGCELFFKSSETMLEIYAPGEVFNIGDIEFSGQPRSRSIVTSSFKIATATTIAVGVSLASIYGTPMGALMAAIEGTAAKEVFDYYFDQPLDSYAVDYKNDTYCKLGVDGYLGAFLELSTRFPEWPTTKSDVIFLSLSPRATKHCGMMKIVFNGVVHECGIRNRDIANLTTTIYVPMFY
jgi:hypothetical protein